MKTIIKHVQYLDPDTGSEQQGHLVMSDGHISGFTGDVISDAHEVVEGDGRWVLPGFIDLHVHFREPGGETKETLESGARAAVAGGFTTVVCMPNTQPSLDHAEILRQQLAKAASLPCQILFMGAVTRGLAGRERIDFKEYNFPGVVGVTDDGRPISEALLMMEALQEGKRYGLLVANHCEDESLMFDRSVNQGAVSEKLGLQGVPALAEELMVQRDLYLAGATGCPVHLQHISTAASVNLIRRAKAEGVPVTAEAAPHHFSLTEYAVMTRGAMAKMSPPLRRETDMRAVRAGLADGTLDCIATDHAPHEAAVKGEDLAKAANGVVGLETAFGAAVTHLMDTGTLSLKQLVTCMSTRPAAMLGLSKKGNLKTGAEADVVLVDLRRRWTVDSSTFASKSHNTPFQGMALRGQVQGTWVRGKRVYENRVTVE
ncbi:dihydroorotase [Anoxynatronum sibiricum]|uniref:Dihydroorotase n=1 Tax=Anoxynatronum sibiricum TaxID=210623 RepID=A0ABU9VUT1_9CLOT